MQTRRYDPTQYERQHRRVNTTAPACCPECGSASHLVIVNGGWECWECDEFIPRAQVARRAARLAETHTE